MTDKKEIIIDGIDVSRCSNYDHGSYLECNVYYCPCDEVPNCYYKQLKRKEQELRNICKAFDIEYVIDKETGILIGRCNKLIKKEQECKELKEWQEANQPTGICETCTARSVDDMYKYKQALYEIEEIAKHNNFLVRDPFCGTGYRDLSGQILNIINQVKRL